MLLSSCYVARYFYWNYADINDYKKFPSFIINKPAVSFHFEEKGSNIKLKLPENFENKKTTGNFEDYLADQKTVAFIIIRNDSIIYENYFYNFNKESILPSFSVAKSFVSALIGIALQERKIESTNDKITQYLSGFKHSGFEKISIADLLNMQSGIKFSEGYSNPFGEMAKFYYGSSLQKYVYKLKTESEPGTTYQYQSANTQILSMILEKATGMRMDKYLEEKIWKPLGMEYDASWNMDSRKHQNIKAFCCLNARARDFAKFGRLYLNNGIWNGNMIISERWIEETYNADEKCRDALSYPYNYHWRIKQNKDFFAKGILGQYIYICPDKNLIMLRFGKKNGKIDWPSFFEELKYQL